MQLLQLPSCASWQTAVFEAQVLRNEQVKLSPLPPCTLQNKWAGKRRYGVNALRAHGIRFSLVSRSSFIAGAGRWTAMPPFLIRNGS